MTTQCRFGFVLEYVTDIEAVKSFYVDVLGLEIEREAPVFVQFKDRDGGNHYAIASDERLSEGKEPEIYWTIDDAEAAYTALSGKGVTTSEVRAMPFGKVFGVTDPAGQQSFLIEFAAQRPSQPVS
jgi:predicted enzyme related to lactoylglutathione lyase